MNEIVLGTRGIIADTALRLGRYVGTGPELFMNLQTAYDLAVAQDRLEPLLHRQQPPRARRG